MSSVVAERHLIPPFFVLFIFNSMQVGVGILGFTRNIAEDAGYDAWISVLLSGLSIAAAIGLIFSVLNKGKGDILSIHQDLFGKWFGGLLSCFFILYFLSLALVVTRTYIEVIQVWVFPTMPTWAMAFGLLLLCFYVVTKGFRLVVGLCFIGTIISLLTLISLLPALEFANYRNVLPVLDHSMIDLLSGTKAMILSFLGIKLVFFYYPFIKNPEQAMKWAQVGNIITTFTYLFIAFITFVFFSQEQLEITIWATISLWQIFEFPFLERFEYTGISLWLLVVIPNICLALWAASRGIRLLFFFNQRRILFLLLIIVLLGAILFQTRQQIDNLNLYVAEAGFYFVYVYIPFLWVAQRIIMKVRRRV
ncbi:GerAB/ArcD/ProY family transporter [Bacillus sp. FJAT-44742]|uniref:GerAB/ArcD/ProY family transporter n=1 Tax=Bacillus sp. FJAT-44742 TaxID=2014005 RepID=UPI0012FE908A|nr:GerAB/ArcD/ProY family transporter [Bacillus sp. FJAT-44742]